MLGSVEITSAPAIVLMMSIPPTSYYLLAIEETYILLIPYTTLGSVGIASPPAPAIVIEHCYRAVSLSKTLSLPLIPYTTLRSVAIVSSPAPAIYQTLL